MNTNLCSAAKIEAPSVESVVEVELLPHYVYILLDPLNGNAPFYVGKGTGLRVRAHFQQLKVEIRNQLAAEAASSDPNTEISPAILDQKNSILKDIFDNEQQPLEVIVGRYKTHEEAYAVEALLMHFLFDHDQLANIAPGKGSKYIRTQKAFMDILDNAKCQDDIEHMPGIDIPIRKYVYDGTYTNAHIEALHEAGTFEFVEKIRANLIHHGYEIRDFSAREDRVFDPKVGTGNLGIIVNICGIDFGLEIRAKNEIKISVYGTEGTCSDASNHLLEEMVMESILILSGPRCPGRGGRWKYKNILGIKKYKEISELISCLNLYRAFLQPRLTSYLENMPAT